MSNANAEMVSTSRVSDQADASVQNTSASPFDALQLHREGAALNSPVAVAENNITPAVYHPAEANTLLAQAGPRVEDVRFDGRRDGYGYGYGPAFGGAIAGALLGEALVNPYGSYPIYPPDYNYGPPQDCYPSQYYGAPPVCYEAPVVPYYGGVPGGYYGGVPGGYGVPRYNEPRGNGGRGRGHR